MILSTRARVCTVFARRKARGPRTITPEHLVRVATTLTWIRIMPRLVVVRALGMPEVRAARLTPLRTLYHKISHRMMGRPGSCSLRHHHLRLLQQLSRLRRSIHWRRIFIWLALPLSQVRPDVPTSSTPSSTRSPWDLTPLQCG